jgi:hypothetical protein
MMNKRRGAGATGKLTVAMQDATHRDAYFFAVDALTAARADAASDPGAASFLGVAIFVPCAGARALRGGADCGERPLMLISCLKTAERPRVFAAKTGFHGFRLAPIVLQLTSTYKFPCT